MHNFKTSGFPLRLSVLFVLIFWLTDSSAQYFTSQSYWKQERHEVQLGIGAINFLGELGGRDAIGTNFIMDLELSMFRPALHLEYRYKTSRKTMVKAGLHYGIIAGNDALTQEPFRNNRNIHFKSNIFELSAKFELTLYEIQPGARYKLIGVKQRPKGGVFYGFAGIGITYFNPKANFNGEWVKLKPLGTEGQNFIDGPKPYSNFTPVVPMGLGYRTYLSSNISLGLEISHRIAFTDYMDDTSTNYYSNSAILAESGSVAAYMADPSLGYRTNDEGLIEPFNTTGTGLQRGDSKDNDSYLFAMVTITHKFTKQRTGHRGKIRVTRKRGGKVIF